MKIEIEINEAQLAQIMWSLGQAIALMRTQEKESSELYTPIDGILCLAGIFYSNCFENKRPDCTPLRKLISTGGTCL